MAKMPPALAVAGALLGGAACCVITSARAQPEPVAEPAPEPAPLLEPEPERVSDSDESDDDGTVQWDVCGHRIQVHQQQIGGNNAADGTGWRMWNSALVLAKYIEANALELLQPRLGRQGGATVRVLDLSAGPGLLGLACAVCAAQHGLDVEVVLSEMPSPSLLQLETNVATANEQLRHKFGAAYKPAEVVPFTWGLQPEGVAADRFTAGFDLVLISDCLFIAVRDHIYQHLRSAMATVCTSPVDAEGTLLLFAYEERLTQEEHQFLKDVETNPAVATESTGEVNVFTTTEVPEDELDLECTLDDGELGGLFAEVAPVRILHMHKCKQTQASTQ